jgi:hypothetical protein
LTFSLTGSSRCGTFKVIKDIKVLSKLSFIIIEGRRRGGGAGT